jgi:APA family basic amino acid/polyamine antiporter
MIPRTAYHSGGRFVSLFARVPIERLQARAEASSGQDLKRALGRIDLVLLGIGAVIGAGIFVLSGQIAGANTGPAIVLSMLLAGIVSALAGLCYAEFASAVPIAGSAYTYAYATLGELIAWVIGWDLVLEYALGSATVAVGWSGHLTSLLRDIGLPFPAALSAAPGTLVPIAATAAGSMAAPAGAAAGAVASAGTVTAVLNLPAVLLVMVVTVLLILGVRESARTNAVMVGIKVTVVVLVVIGGVWFIVPRYWVPFVPPNTGTYGEYGVSGVLRGAAIIFFAYIGFDAVSTAAQEAKEPQRDMPVGILGSLAVCTLLYMIVAAVMVGLVPYESLKNSAAPMIVALDAALGRSTTAAAIGWLRVLRGLVEIGALAGMTSVVMVQMMAQSRIFYAMANDGLLPAWAKRTHPRWRTPHLATLVTGAGVAVAAGLTPIAVLDQLVSIGTLFAFMIVSIGVIVLRRTAPDLPRSFRVPLMPWTPVLAVAVCLLLMYSLPSSTWIRLFIWMGIGFVIYFTYGYRHSALRQVAEGEAQPGAVIAER